MESAAGLESVPPRTAPPSAAACASVSAEVERMKRPPACTVIAPIIAREVVFARLIANAAATETPPDDVAAWGVGSAPAVPLPPAELSVALAKLRSAATELSTPLPALPPPDASPGAPAAEAAALADVSEEPCAASDTAPPAFTLRRRVDSLKWLAIVSASAKPIEALEPAVSPEALV